MNYTVGNLVNIVNAIRFVGDESTVVTRIVSLGKDDTDLNTLTWCSDSNGELLKGSIRGTVIVSKTLYEQLGTSHDLSFNMLVVEHPRRAFSSLLKHISAGNQSWGIHSKAVLSETVEIAEPVSIGAGAVIEEGVKMGRNVRIGSNTVIQAGTTIADNVSIGSNCTIGGVGFGYELNDAGEYEVLPHIGNVVIEEQVEIGNNVCIDRAVVGSTRIGFNVKIDNLVHIAHGVDIGANSLIIANAMIAGSCRIGENVWVAPSASVIQKKTIGDNSLIGMGSVVLGDVESDSVYAGVPAKKIKSR